MKSFEQYLKDDSKYAKLSEKIESFQSNQNEYREKATKGLMPGGNADDVAFFNRVNEELKLDAIELESTKSLLKIQYDKEVMEAEGAAHTVNAIGNGGQPASGVKSLSQAVIDSPAYKAIPELSPGVKNWSIFKEKVTRWDIPLDVYSPQRLKSAYREGGDDIRGMKDITTATVATLPMLLPTFVPTPVYPATVWNVLPSFQLANPTVTYRKETSHTNNAAATTEGSRISSASVFAASLQTDSIENVAGYFKISEQEMRSRPDIMEVMTFFANRDLGIAVEQEVLTGSGSAPHLNGIYTQATGSYAKVATNPDGSSQTDIDALAFAWLKLRVNGVCVPDTCIVYPNQFLPIRLTKDALGNYIFGPPSEDKPEVYVFGIRLLQSLYAVDTQALMGDFRSYYSLGIYQGINVELGFDGNDFTSYERTLRFSIMCLNQVRRTAAFSIITGLNSYL